MAFDTIKIMDLPSATQVVGDDYLVVEQPDKTKKATAFQIISDLDLANKSSLTGSGGAGIIGTEDGEGVQKSLDTDRANTRELWRRALHDLGLTLVDGSFEEGATLTYTTDAIWHMSGAQCYTWSGTFPKSVSAGSTPSTTGSGWITVGGLSLLDEVTEIKNEAVEAKDQAEDARDEAQAYVLQASELGNLYASVSEGLAATTDGQYFQVPQGSDSSVAFKVYKNSAGVAQEVARVPGTAAITGTIREFPTLAAAQADVDAGNISVGSTAYYRSADDATLAVEVINHGGTLEPTGRKMPSQNYIDQRIGLSDSGNIAMQTDSTGQVITVTDDFGGVSIPDVPGTLQEALAPVKTNRAPAILRLSDAENAAYGSVDDFGGLNLPGIPTSVQHMLNNHQDKIQNLIRNGRVLDVRDCGFNAKTGENAVYAIQRAINWLSGQGGGVVYLPQANYLLSSYITPRSNVSIIGAGVDKSVLLPYKSFAAFRRIGNVNDYLQNVIMSDFTIDGANQVLNPTSGYLPEIKGTVILYWKDCVMDKLKMVNTGATALGNDMPYNCSIMRCYIENAGRLVPNRDAGIWERPLGASGIGLGTGALDDEPIYVAFNTVRNCANFGLFFEPQGGGAARGAVAIGNILEGNYAGLSDCGVDGLQAVSNQMRFNKFGILRYPGTNNGGKPGRRGQFIGNIVDSNTEHGIYSYSTKTDPLIGWNIYSNNQVTNNGKDGFNFRYTNPAVGMQNETVSGNHIYANGRHGINIEESLSVTNCDFLSNKIWGNGQKEAGNGVNSAVSFTACSINGNQIRDTQTVPTQQYPINLTGVLTDVDISMNHCVGNVNNTINTPNLANQRVTKNINSGAL